MNLLKKFWNEEDGQDLVEYGLLLGSLVLGVASFAISIGAKVESIFTNVNTQMQTIPTA